MKRSSVQNFLIRKSLYLLWNIKGDILHLCDRAVYFEIVYNLIALTEFEHAFLA